MRVLDVGEAVILLRFLPDGRRLLVATASAGNRVRFAVWPLAGGDPVRPPLPDLGLTAWLYDGLQGGAAAIHPSGESCYVAWGGTLFAFRTADGRPLPVPAVPAHQVAITPDGSRLLTASRPETGKELTAIELTPGGGDVIWRKPLRDRFYHLAGFLPGGDRFAIIDNAVRVLTLPAGEEQATTRFSPHNTAEPTQCQLSPDGRQLGVVLSSAVYLYDPAALGSPRIIGGPRSSGEVGGIAFHPDGRRLAVLQGGPKAVRMHDLETLEVSQTCSLSAGALACVAISPAGTVGAAGTRTGRVVIWDVDPPGA